MLPLPFSGGPAYATVFWCSYGLWAVLETIGLLLQQAGQGAAENLVIKVLREYSYFSLGSQ